MSIEIKNLNKSFGGRAVLENLSLSIPDRGIFGLYGPSGCGKTTLIRILSGLEKADSGVITGLEGRKISLMFQEDRLPDSCTVLKNVALVSDDERAEEILTYLGLGDDLGKYPRQLSGGMARRVALARALAYGGDILILDEPFKGLETELRKKAESLIKDYSRSHTVILVTHDEEEKQMADAFISLG